jgi:Fuc2NAc and GlcNAc transferase
MTIPLLLSVTALAFIATWIGVEVFRRWTLRRNLLDEPNERSSHTIPTPRGGGLVIVAITIVGYVVVSLVTGSRPSPGYLAGALIVAGVSWLDDLYSLPFWTRLIAHIAAACLIVMDLGGFQSIHLPLVSTDIAIGRAAGAAIAVVWLVGLVNAYNFMDGIDGIASLQSIVASGAWLTVGLVFGWTSPLILASMLLAASAGFLIHNWQPAKIFMGDVGSAFIGFTLAALPLVAGTESSSAFIPLFGIVVVWLFVFDTVLTMFKRAFKGERIWEAHRQHHYPQMIIAGMSHAAVTSIYGVAAAIIALTAALIFIFAGNYSGLLVLSIVGITSMILFSSLWKKR